MLIVFEINMRYRGLGQDKFVLFWKAPKIRQYSVAQLSTLRKVNKSDSELLIFEKENDSKNTDN